MKSLFSLVWKKSTQIRKQRKYAANAPNHIKSKFVSASLSKDLKKKHSLRSIRVRKGDTVKVLRGQFKGVSGVVEKVDMKNTKLYINGVQQQKKDGSKSYYPTHPSNVMVTELEMSDKKRFK